MVRRRGALGAIIVVIVLVVTIRGSIQNGEHADRPWPLVGLVRARMKRGMPSVDMPRGA